ncbi:MAG TPA: hypothetical protein ENI12_04910 [Nitrospirae bacterium]|nr:hypothetical protein [Nitrospirota bacterium]
MRYSNVPIIGVLTVAIALLVALEANAATFSVSVLNVTKQEALAKYPVKVSVGNKDSQGNFKPQGTVESQTREDGIAAGEINQAGASLVRAEVLYRGVHYRSEPVQMISGKEDYALQVSVYEITDVNSSVSIESRRMIILTKNARTLEIYETLVVSNKGKMTYVGRFDDELDMHMVLFIPMPWGYMLNGFSGYDTQKVRTLGSGLTTQNEIIPGTNEISIHYYVQSDTGEFDLDLLTQKDAPEIDTFTLHFPKENAWKLKQSALSKSGEEYISKIPYVILKGMPGSALRLKVFGPTYKGGFGLWHVSIILSFVLAVITLFLSRASFRSLALAREEQRLQNLIEELDQESSDNDAYGKYAFMRQTIKKRMEYISDYFDRS